jgi:hypothetical protein
VSYMANPVFFAFRDAGGQSHSRPFGGAANQYPKKLHLQQLDRWSRAAQSFPFSSSPQSLGAGVGL